MSDTTKIGGGIKLGKSTSAPTQEEGLIYYDDTAKKFKARNDQAGFFDFADDSDVQAAQADATAAKTKTDFLTLTQAVDLDTMESDVTSNSAAVSALTTGYNRRAAVISIADSTAVPATEVSGDRYILGFDGATHANWDGAAQGDIVQFDGASWIAVTPVEGYIAYVDDVNKDALFTNDGSAAWELRNIAPGSTTDLVEGTNLYYTEGRVTANTSVTANTAKVSNVSTNLGYTTAASTGTVTSSDGTDATLPSATTSLAGLLTGTDKTKLDGIATAATANIGDFLADGSVDLSGHLIPSNNNGWNIGESLNTFSTVYAKGMNAGASGGLSLTTTTDLQLFGNNIKLTENSTASVVGEVWTAKGVDGSGNWEAASVGADASIGTHSDVDLTGASGSDDGKVLKYTHGSGFALAADASGTGDFLADGTVTMTGNLQLGANNITDISQVLGNAGSDVLFASGTTGSGTSGKVTVATGITGGSGLASGQLHLNSGNTTAGSNPTGNVFVYSGDSIGSVSGDVTLEIGTGISRGDIILKDGSEGTVGHIWTSTGTAGEGNWAVPGSGADDMGDHIATKNLDMNQWSIEMDGGAIFSKDKIGTATEDIQLTSGAVTGSAAASGTVTIGSGDTTGTSGNVLISAGLGTVDSGSVLISAAGGAPLLISGDGASEVFVSTSDNLGTSAIINMEGSISSNSSANGGSFQIAGGAIEAESTGAEETFQLLSGSSTIKSGFVEMNIDTTPHVNSIYELSSGAVNILTADAIIEQAGVSANSGAINITTGASDGSGTRGDIKLAAATTLVGDGTNPDLFLVSEAGFSGMGVTGGNPSQVFFLTGSGGDGSGNGGLLQVLGGDVEANSETDTFTGGNLILRSGGDPGTSSQATDYGISSGDVIISTEDAKIGDSDTITGAGSGEIAIKTGASAGDGDPGSILFSTGANASKVYIDTDGGEHFIGSTEDLGSTALLNLEGSIMTGSDGTFTGGSVRMLGGGQDFDGTLTAHTTYTTGSVSLESGYLAKADITAGAFNLSMNSGDINLTTTDGQAANAGSGSSGNINLKTGGAEGSSGERGVILVDAPSVNRSSDGTNFVEEEYVDSITVPASSTTVLSEFSFADTVYGGVEIVYTLKTSAGSRMGRLFVTQDGTNADIINLNVETVALGISFTVANNAGTIEISATDASGNAGTMRADVKKFRI